MRPYVIDLFCGEGGAGKGYSDAGFGVKGYDLSEKALRRYPFDSAPVDWRAGLTGWCFEHADLIHASPPCQLYSVGTKNANRANHPDLIGPVREALIATGKPYVIENVPGAPLRDPVELCGCMFGMQIEHEGQRFALYRPRWFEASFPILAPVHQFHEYPAMPVYGNNAPGWFYRKWGYGTPASVRAELMGTQWMTRDGVSQSIPPAFAEFTGREFLASAALKAAA